MNKQQSNQMSSLKKKLLAAIAMLLVACIMTVSSTYAWFTLSTAPEVKGIATTIGANGNLEMALGTYDTVFGSGDPSSYVGSSNVATDDWTETNITWGNLVDLSEGYGLDKITLYPARLNSDTGALVNRQSPLMFPKYGADGRVSELDDNTLVGAYDATSNGFVYKPGQTATGVSGIGKTASMSKRAFAIMNGKSAIASGKSAAANAAKDAIRLYGGQLAAIALKYQNDDGTGVVAEADITVLKSLIAKLTESHTALSESMKSAVLVVLAAEDSLNDDQWAIAAGLADGKDIVAYIAALQTDYSSVTLPTELTDMIAAYEAIGTKLTDASGDLPESGDGTWANIKDSVSALLNASGIKIGGYTIDAVKADYKTNGMGGDVVKDLFNKVSDGSLAFSFTATSGIFADIADLTGNYTSSMAFPEGTTVEGLDLNMLGSKSVVVEGDNGATGSLGALAAADVIVNAQAPAADADADVPLTDTFGYIVDLLFRTNATESDLLLQVEAANRYAEGAIDETMGGGSNMTFAVNAEYTKEKIEGLAAGIRVVFFDKTGAILAVATLDATNGKLAGDAYKMNLQLSQYTIAADGVISITGPKADNKICALTANVKTAVSALVYLDGDVIDNSHAGVQTGLEAMLNLQFASSVELTPMVDSDLMGE